jgi:DNA segregation ATPase FtsK/SpoIIIE-like protein
VLAEERSRLDGHLQRRLRIGYGRAAHLIDLMEPDSLVGA